MAYRIVDDRLGSQPIADTSSTQRHALGTLVRAVDDTYGEGLFLYLKGSGNTTTGSVVLYDQRAGTTTPVTLDVRGPLAVAMAATTAGLYGWYQVRGSAVVLANTATNGQEVYVYDESGYVDAALAVANRVDGMTFRSALNTPSTGYAVVEIAFPSANANGTA